MYERMLNKHLVPTMEEMAAYCGESAELFTRLNDWLCNHWATEQTIVFPYGNRYGWGVAHKRKKKLVCNIFAENQSFTVMLRLSNRQFEQVYGELREDTRECIDKKYPCGDGGWIHYRVISKEQLPDMERLLAVKCS